MIHSLVNEAKMRLAKSVRDASQKERDDMFKIIARIESLQARSAKGTK